MANHDDAVAYDEFKNQYKNPALMTGFLDADWDSGKATSSRSVTFAVDDVGATVSPVEEGRSEGINE